MNWLDELAIRWLLWRQRPVVMNCTIESGVQLVQSPDAIVIRNRLLQEREPV